MVTCWISSSTGPTAAGCGGWWRAGAPRPGLIGSRLDDFVLAVHEIAANAIVHAGTGGRLTLQRAANGLRCLIADHQESEPAGRVPRARAARRPVSRSPGEPMGQVVTRRGRRA